MKPAWSRDDAERTAREHLAAFGPAMREPVFTVRTLSEVDRPPAIYGLVEPEKILPRSWLVYVSEKRPLVLKSSWLIVVSRTDSSVKYAGSANDEG